MEATNKAHIIGQVNIDIQKASPEEKYLLRNLMELYQHDYSEFNPTDVNEYGLFGYTYLDHYWTEPERHPFLVRVDNSEAHPLAH